MPRWYLTAVTQSTLGQIISGTGTVTQAGRGTTSLTGRNTYTGTTTVSVGELRLINWNDSDTYTISSGAVLNYDIASGNTIDLPSTTYNGSGTLRKSGAGTLYWGAGAATISMASGGLVDVRAGAFEVGHSSNDVWTNNLADLNIEAGATFTNLNNNMRIDALTGAGTLRSGWATDADFIDYGVDNGSGTFSGILADTNSGPGGKLTLVKYGTGTQTFTGTSTYTGDFYVRAGTVDIASGASISGVRRIDVGGTAGATLNVAGTLSVGSGGGFGVGSGTGGTGTVNVTGALNIGTGSSSVFIGGMYDNAGTTGTGTLNVNNGGVVTVGAGTATGANSGLYLNPWAGSNSTINLYTGGTLTTSRSIKNGTTNAANVNFKGGTLKSGLNNLNLIENPTGLVVSIDANGGFVDSNGFTASIEKGITNATGVTTSGTLTKIGAGRLNLTGDNSFNGQIAVNVGHLAITGSGRLGLGNFTSNITTASGTIVEIGTTATQSISGVISGDGELQKWNTGTLTLSGTNTYTGRTLVGAGVLSVSSLDNGGQASNIGASTNAAANLEIGGGTLHYNGSSVSIDRAFTLSAGQSGRIDVHNASTNLTINGAGANTTGNLIKVGVGTLTLGGDNRYTGTTTISAGTLAIGGAGSLGGSAAASYAGNIVNNASLVFNTNTAQTLSGIISGAGTLTQSGSGMLTLTNTNTYTGVSTVNKDSVLRIQNNAPTLNSSSYTGQGHLMIESVADSFASAYTLDRSKIGVALNRLTVGKPSNTQSVVLNGDVTTLGAQTYYGAMQISGSNVTLTAQSEDISITGSIVPDTHDSRTLTLNATQGYLSIGGDIGTPTKALYDLRMNALGMRINRDTAFYTTNDVFINFGIIKDSGADATLQIKAGRHISLGQSSSINATVGKLNVLLHADTGKTGNGIVQFLGNSIVTNGGYFKTGLAETHSAGYLVGGDLYLAHGAAQTINTAGGDIVINGELIAATPAGLSINAGAGNIEFKGVVNSGNAYSFVRQTSGGSWDDARLAAKNGTAGGAAVGDSYLVNISSRLENAIAGLAADYRGAWIGAYRANSYSYDWSWADGPEAGQVFFTQRSGGGGTAQASLYSNFGAGEPNGSLGGRPSVETVGQFFGTRGQWNDLVHTTAFSSSSSQYAVWGYVRETNLASTPLTISSSGNVTFQQAVGAGKVLENLVVSGNAVNFNNTLALGTQGATITNSAAGKVAGAISGAGQLTKDGAGTFTLESNNTYAGTTTISAGTMQVGAGGTMGTLGAGDVTNNAALVFNRSVDLTVSNKISGTGSLTQNGSNRLALTGANDYSGDTLLNAGTLNLGSATAIGGTGSTGGTIHFGGGILQYSANSATDYSARFSTANNQFYKIDTNGQAVTLATSLISNGGSLTKLGTGRLTLAVDNTYSGGTTISAGELQVGVGGTAGTMGSGGLTNSGLLSINRSDTVTLAYDMGGTGSLEQMGSGTTILTGNNTYSGTTSILAGRLKVGAGGTTGTLGSGKLTNSSILTIDRSDTVTISALLDGAGSFEQVGSGTTILTGNNIYSGTTTISQGALQIGDGGATGSLGRGNVSVASGSSLITNRTGGFSINANITGDGKFVQKGTGLVDLAGINNFTGGVFVEAGTLALSSNAAAGFTGGLTMGVDSNSVTTLALTPGVTLSNNVTLNGAVSLVLALPVQYMIVGGGGGGGAGFATTAAGGGGGAGGVLYGTTLMTATTAGITVGVGGQAGTNSSTGATGGGSSSAFGLTAAGGGGGGQWSVTAGNGASGGGGGTNTTSANSVGGSATQGNAGGTGATYSAGSTLGGGGGGGFGGAGESLTSTSMKGGAGGVGFEYDITGQATWYAGGGGGGSGTATGGLGGSGVGGNGGAINTVGQAGTSNTGSGGGGGGNTSSGSRAGGAGGSGVVILRYAAGSDLASGGTESVGSNGATGSQLHQFTTNGTFSLTGTGFEAGITGAISGSGSLSANANFGTITLAAANGYTGDTTVKGGTVKVTNASGLGNQSAVSLDNTAGAKLQLANVSSTASSNPLTVSIGSLAGGGTTGGNIELGQYTTLSTGGLNATTSFAGATSGAGGLEKTGTGVQTMSGTNTYTGATTVSGGTLRAGSTRAFGSNSAVSLANVSGATLDLANFNNSIGSLAGGGSTGGNVTLGSATLTLGGANSNTSFAGSISGTGILSKEGTGTQELTGNSLYTGITTITAGKLRLAGAGTLGYTASGTGTYAANITNNATLEFASSATQTLSGVISGTGTLLKDVAGTVELTNANTFSGGTTVSGGTLKLSYASGTGVSTIRGVLNVNTGGTVTYGVNHSFGWVSGQSIHTLNINGGTVDGTGYSNHFYGGSNFTLNMTGGKLIVGGGDSPAGTLAVNILAASTSAEIASDGVGKLTLDKATTFNVADGSAAIDLLVSAPINRRSTSAPTLTKAGAGVMSLTGANLFPGNLAINEGTLSIDGAGSLGGTSGSDYGGGISIASGATLVNNSSAAQLWSSTISGTGSLTQKGSGLLKLTGDSSFTGATTVTNNSTLQIGNYTTTGYIKGNVQIDAGSTLQYQRDNNAGTWTSYLEHTLSGAGTVRLMGRVAQNQNSYYVYKASPNFTGQAIVEADARVGIYTGNAFGTTATIEVKNLGGLYLEVGSGTLAKQPEDRG